MVSSLSPFKHIIVALKTRTVEQVIAQLDAVESASNSLHADSANASPPDLVHRNNRQSLLVVVHSLDDTAKGTALERGSDHRALDAHDVEAMTSPVGSDVHHDEDEADCRDNIGDASVVLSGDGALDWREDGCS